MHVLSEANAPAQGLPPRYRREALIGLLTESSRLLQKISLKFLRPFWLHMQPVVKGTDRTTRQVINSMGARPDEFPAFKPRLTGQVTEYRTTARVTTISSQRLLYVIQEFC